MSITKDQASDLRSYLNRIVTCSAELEKAKDALKLAQGNLESFLWNLEHGVDNDKLPKRGPTP